MSVNWYERFSEDHSTVIADIISEHRRADAAHMKNRAKVKRALKRLCKAVTKKTLPHVLELEDAFREEVSLTEELAFNIGFKLGMATPPNGGQHHQLKTVLLTTIARPELSDIAAAQALVCALRAVLAQIDQGPTE